MPNTYHIKNLIVGAGLSGLTTAYELNKRGREILVLESRDRLGGRILTNDRIDFGATWFQEHHEKLDALLAELEVETFPQYSEGKSVLVYSTMAPAHHFENDPKAPRAKRIKGGSIALINKLSEALVSKIKCSEKVISIDSQEEGLLVTTENAQYLADSVVITLPPRLASQIKYAPLLPDRVIQVMKNTHTWMSNAIKVGITYTSPFWRNKNLSGMIIGQVGPVVELYDHTDYDSASFSLMGFVNETLRESTAEERQKRIIDYLATHLGEEILGYINYSEKDWSRDFNTSEESIKSLYMSPEYGHPVFQLPYLDGRLYFSGAETSTHYGGYMEGAVHSGYRAARALMARN